MLAQLVLAKWFFSRLYSRHDVGTGLPDLDVRNEGLLIGETARGSLLRMTQVRD